MIKKVQLDGVVIHDITQTNPLLQLTRDNIKGLGGATYRISSADRSGEDGGTVSASLLSIRSLALPGNVRATDAAGFAAARRTLRQACATQRDEQGRPVLKRMFITTLDDVQYFADVVVADANIDVQWNTQANWLVQLLVPDGILYVNDPQTTGWVSRPVDGGAPFPWVFDPTIEFAPTTGGTAALANYGETSSYPVLSFRGPATNPTLVNQTLSKTFALNTTLALGDTVLIDMKEHTIVWNGTTNYFPFRVDGSDWFSMKPGDNVFSFSTGNSSDTGAFKLDYFPGALGI